VVDNLTSLSFTVNVPSPASLRTPLSPIILIAAVMTLNSISSMVVGLSKNPTTKRIVAVSSMD